MTSPRLVLALLAALFSIALAGCGDGGGSSSDPASAAPAKSPLFIEASLRPTGETKSNLEALAQKIAGIDDLGATIVEELESGSSGGEVDYGKDVEPWLGDKGAFFFQRYDGDEFTGVGAVIQSTDPEVTQAFIDEQAQSSDEPIEDASYEGLDYKVDSEDGTAIGVIGDFFVFGEDEQTFQDAVDAYEGESLAEVERYEDAVAAAPGDSFADVYVDVGDLIRQSGEEIDSQARGVLEGAGVDPDEATALASVTPGSDLIEIDVSSDLEGTQPPTGDASALLGTLPADSFAALAVSGFGDELGEAIDSLDKSGIPPDVPPGQLKSTLKAIGIDLDKLAASVSDGAAFATGGSESSLGGALVLSTDNSGEAADAVASLGSLLRFSKTPGVTAVSGKASGFSIRDPELGPRPAVVVAKGERIAIGYGLAETLRGLSTSGARLADDPDYKAGTSALGNTPIDAFVDGPAALQLAEALVPRSETDFQNAKPYLRKVRFIAVGSGSEGELATAKLIVGIEK